MKTTDQRDHPDEQESPTKRFYLPRRAAGCAGAPRQQAARSSPVASLRLQGFQRSPALPLPSSPGPLHSLPRVDTRACAIWSVEGRFGSRGVPSAPVDTTDEDLRAHRSPASTRRAATASATCPHRAARGARGIGRASWPTTSDPWRSTPSCRQDPAQDMGDQRLAGPAARGPRAAGDHHPRPPCGHHPQRHPLADCRTTSPASPSTASAWGSPGRLISSGLNSNAFVSGACSAGGSEQGHHGELTSEGWACPRTLTVSSTTRPRSARCPVLPVLASRRPATLPRPVCRASAPLRVYSSPHAHSSVERAAIQYVGIGRQGRPHHQRRPAAGDGSGPRCGRPSPRTALPAGYRRAASWPPSAPPPPRPSTPWMPSPMSRATKGYGCTSTPAARPAPRSSRRCAPTSRAGSAPIRLMVNPPQVDVHALRLFTAADALDCRHCARP